MSVRAEILRLGLRLAKNWHIRERVPLATARRRLRRIESLVPRPPAGTQTTAIEAGGVNAVRVAVRRPLRSLFPRRRLRARHREAGAGFHLAYRRRRARPRALLRLSARPRTSVPGGARRRGRRLSLARRPVRSPADRLHGRFGGRRARARNALQAAR